MTQDIDRCIIVITTLQLRLTLNAQAKCWWSSESQSAACWILFLIQITLPNFRLTHSLRHKDQSETPISVLALALYTIKPQPRLCDVHPKVLEKFFLCPWKFGFSRKCNIQARFSRAIHIKTLSEKCPALPSKWKCFLVIAALFFHYDPSIFTHQFIFSLFVFSTLLYLTFPSEGVTCELPQQPFIWICQWELNFHFHSCRKALLTTDGVNLLTLVLKQLPGDETLPQLCTFSEIPGNRLSSDE